MYVYLESGYSDNNGFRMFTVGFYKPDGEWNPESDHRSRDEAAARVRYLNGGNDDDNI